MRIIQFYLVYASNKLCFNYVFLTLISLTCDEDIEFIWSASYRKLSIEPIASSEFLDLTDSLFSFNASNIALECTISLF